MGAKYLSDDNKIDYYKDKVNFLIRFDLPSAGIDRHDHIMHVYNKIISAVNEVIPEQYTCETFNPPIFSPSVNADYIRVYFSCFCFPRHIDDIISKLRLFLTKYRADEMFSGDVLCDVRFGWLKSSNDNANVINAERISSIKEIANNRKNKKMAYCFSCDLIVREKIQHTGAVNTAALMNYRFHHVHLKYVSMEGALDERPDGINAYLNEISNALNMKGDGSYSIFKTILYMDEKLK